MNFSSFFIDIPVPAQPSDKKIHIEKLTELFLPWFSIILLDHPWRIIFTLFENLPCSCFQLESALLFLACLLIKVQMLSVLKLVHSVCHHTVEIVVCSTKFYWYIRSWFKSSTKISLETLVFCRISDNCREYKSLISERSSWNVLKLFLIYLRSKRDIIEYFIEFIIIIIFGCSLFDCKRSFVCIVHKILLGLWHKGMAFG